MAVRDVGDLGFHGSSIITQRTRSERASISSPRDISSFTLKIIAIAGMTGNHAAYVLGPLLPAWLAVALFSLGGLTFPIMAFLVVEGYRHTSNLRRYASRLLLFTLISQIPYSLLLGAAGNVLITLTLGLACVYAVDGYPRPS